MNQTDITLLSMVETSTYRQMVEATDLKSTSSVAYRLRNLAEAGYITSAGGKHKTARLREKGKHALAHPDEYPDVTDAHSASGPHYTDEEKETVRANAGTLTAAQIAALLPGRTPDSVRTWAMRNGVSLKNL